MDRILLGNPCISRGISPISISRGLRWGFFGGLTGTIIMDAVLMGTLSAIGWPVLTCFSIVGNTVARFFTFEGLEMARTIQLGVLTHYLIGPLVGGIFGALVARIKALHVHTIKKSILLAIIYIESLSQPIVATAPILLRMGLPQILQWYIGSLVMHLILGIVLGTVMGYGLQLPTSENHRQFP